jgi:HK97 gp10 family phage protein
MLSGDKELRQHLRAMKKKANGAIRRGSRAGSKVVKPVAQFSAPFLTGKLQQSIKVKALPRSRSYVGTQVTFAFDDGSFYGGFQEYGTKHNKALHFMQRAFNQSKSRALATFLTTIEENI